MVRMAAGRGKWGSVSGLSPAGSKLRGVHPCQNLAMMTPNFADKTVWTGDNLDILRRRGGATGTGRRLSSATWRLTTSSRSPAAAPARHQTGGAKCRSDPNVISHCQRGLSTELPRSCSKAHWNRQSLRLQRGVAASLNQGWRVVLPYPLDSGPVSSTGDVLSRE